MASFERLVSDREVRMRGLAGRLVFIVAVLSWADVRAEDQIRFVTLEFAPFIYGENEQVAGPGRDVIEAACDRAAIACSYDIYPWRRAQALMKSGDADGMMVIGRNPEREEWLQFSPPMFRTEYGFFVQQDNAMEFDDVAQIAGFRVGVFAPSNTATQLEGIRTEMISLGLDPIVIEGHPDDAAGMRKLAAGRLDAVYSNRDRAWDIVQKEQLDGKVRYAGQHQELFYFAGIHKSYRRQEVIDRFFDAWRALFASGEAQAMIEKYGLEPADLD